MNYIPEKNSAGIGRRGFLKIISRIGIAAPWAAFPWATTLFASFKRSDRVNILFIMDDQHRGDCIGAAGAGWLKTPNLDRLAGEGALFRKAYTSLPSCLPARTSLLTGKSPWLHGVLLYTPMAHKYKYEKPRMFTSAGYRTHAVGKMHFNSYKHGYETVILEEAFRGYGNRKFKCDYRKWFEKNYPDKDVDATGLSYTDHRGGRPFKYADKLHPTHWTAQQAVDFLETYKGSRPWFLKVSFKRPHPPFDPPKRFMKYYEGIDLPKAKVGAWAKKEFGRFKGSVEKTPTAPRGVYPESEIHRSRAAYFASITYVDDQVGRVIKALEKRGELENTLILFTADHGDMMGDQNLWRKTYAYEGSAHIPMIIRWPRRFTRHAKITSNNRDSSNSPGSGETNNQSLSNPPGNGETNNQTFSDPPGNGETNRSENSWSRIKRGQIIDQLVELRDVLPTFLDAAGIKKPGEMDGMSMLNLVRGKTGSWRKILDLEHGTCYWKQNAWVALTDGRYKYIYFTLTGRQQLFDLKNDPHELDDMAEEKKHEELLALWRKRMIRHLVVRGEPWVKNGDLAVQKHSARYSPNDPRFKQINRKA